MILDLEEPAVRVVLLRHLIRLCYPRSEASYGIGVSVIVYEHVLVVSALNQIGKLLSGRASTIPLLVLEPMPELRHRQQGWGKRFGRCDFPRLLCVQAGSEEQVKPRDRSLARTEAWSWSEMSLLGGFPKDAPAVFSS